MDLTSIPVTLTIIFANVAITIWTHYANPVYFRNLSEWPYQIIHEKKYYQALTSGFLHAGFAHLLFNMFALFSFGSILEQLFVFNFGELNGRVFYLLIYFISLFSGSLLTVLFHHKDPNYVAVGASGAISGIIFSYVIFFPFNQISVMFVPMPAFVFAFLYIAISVYGMKARFGNIGHEAHLGGALGGFIATLILIEGAWGILLSHFQ